jgi:hypothetical protein
MTDTPGDDVAAMDEDAGSTVRSEDEGRSDLPGVGGGDVDPMDGSDSAAPGVEGDLEGTGEGGAEGTGEGGVAGLGDADDVEPGAGAVEPPD